MKELENKIFVLDNGEKYSVVETVSYNNKIYAYLVNINDEMDSMFKEVCILDNEINLEDIDKDLFKKNIVGLFIERIKSS